MPTVNNSKEKNDIGISDLTKIEFLMKHISCILFKIGGIKKIKAFHACRWLINKMTVTQ